MTQVTMPPPKLRIAVMLEQVQISDIIGADLFGNISQSYVKDTAAFMPDFTSVAPDIEFFYPAVTLETWCTPDIKVIATHTYQECPRDLDILLIGGPLPTHRPKEAHDFMKEAFPRSRLVMTTCIGSMWLASSGVIDGMKATTNREALPIARNLYPQIEWLDQRWVVDNGGKLWTSGGAGAGVEMIVEYMLENFDKDLVRVMAMRLLEFDPQERGQYYQSPMEYDEKLLTTDWKQFLPVRHI